MTNNKDYVFHINWEDRHKQSYKVGILAQLDEMFYLVIKDKEKAETAYSKGFIGIPGFRQEEIYRSHELFDFFKNRILQKNDQNPCEELAVTKAKSMVDSYWAEKVPDKVTKKYRKIILEAYDLQEKKKMAEEVKNSEQPFVEEGNDSTDFRDVI